MPTPPRIGATNRALDGCGPLPVRKPPEMSRMHIHAYTPPVVQWDPDKAEANQRKHGVDFADAALVLTDELALTMPDSSPDEERFVTIGSDALGRVLVVTYSWRGDDVRLISARKATRAERRQYENTR